MSKSKNMSKKEKMAWYLQRDFELMFVITIIGIIVDVVQNVAITYVGLRIVRLILLALAVSLSKKQAFSAAVIGLVAGILMILSGSTLSLILGIFLCIHAVSFITLSAK